MTGENAHLCSRLIKESQQWRVPENYPNDYEMELTLKPLCSPSQNLKTLKSSDFVAFQAILHTG